MLILYNAPPWRWPHEWPKQVRGMWRVQYFHTLMCNCYWWCYTQLLFFAVMYHLKSNFISDANGPYSCMCCEFHVRGNCHKVRHPCCVYNKLDWSVYTCLTQLYGGRDMYNYTKNKYMFRPFSLAIFRLIIEKLGKQLQYTWLVWVVSRGEVRGGVGTRSRMCCVGWVV